METHGDIYASVIMVSHCSTTTTIGTIKVLLLPNTEKKEDILAWFSSVGNKSLKKELPATATAASGVKNDDSYKTYCH